MVPTVLGQVALCDQPEAVFDGNDGFALGLRQAPPPLKINMPPKVTMKAGTPK